MRNDPRKTWRGKPQTVAEVTLQSLLDSCQQNIADAAKLHGELRALYARLPPGDKRFNGGYQDEDGFIMIPLIEQIIREKQNQKHWREYVAHYRQRIAKEGPQAMVKIPIPPRIAEMRPPEPRLTEVRPAPPVEADPRLPKDWDDEVPF